MLKIIGGLLIVYAVIAITILFILRKDAIKLWDLQIDKFKQVIERGKGILQPITDAAKATRSGGEHVIEFTEDIKNTIPPAIQSTVETLENITTTLSNLPNDIKDFVTNTSNDLEESVDVVISSWEYLTINTIPITTKSLRDLSRDLDQPLYWLTDEALTLLEKDDHVPNDVILKIQSFVGKPYRKEKTLRDNLAEKLTDDEIKQYVDKIVSRSQNSEYGTGLVDTINETRLLLQQIGSESLPAVADSIIEAKNVANALLAVTYIMAGPLVLFATSARTVSDAYLTIFGHSGARVSKGEWGSLPLPQLGIPAGALIKFHKRFIKFQVPTGDYKIPGMDNIDFPPTDITLFRGRKLAEALEDIRDRSNDLINVIRSASFSFDIDRKLQDAADKLRTTASKILEQSENPNRLPKQIEKLQKQADVLSQQADKFEEAAIEIGKVVGTLQKQLKDILKTLQTFADKAVNAIVNVQNALQDLARKLKDISIDEALNELNGLGNNLKDLANSIDDGQPPNTSGKKDLVQRLMDIFNSLYQSIPPRKQIIRIFNGIFGFLIIIHIFFLVTGIVLVQTTW
ncbi:hypothetical protein [Bacillus cereus]|uniref:hypothetical protein n=1 Tax=Bacillus cereus TaxID=1396 RepID=UPI00217DBD5B|nr:hypothetical protein [Bacillus cereus]MCS6595299.1 hypothetical protein [Bacillus cereus]